jgi:hypothetical protein
MKHKPSKDEQTEIIREWAAAYRLWNEQELTRRQAKAGQQSVEEKLTAFFDLCETMFQISPPKSTALYQAQLRAHLDERQRMLRFEELRAHGKSAA